MADGWGFDQIFILTSSLQGLQGLQGVFDPLRHDFDAGPPLLVESRVLKHSLDNSYTSIFSKSVNILIIDMSYQFMIEHPYTQQCPHIVTVSIKNLLCKSSSLQLQ